MLLCLEDSIRINLIYWLVAKIWDSKTLEEMQFLKEHTASVMKVCFSKNGKFLATCSEDKTIKIWT